MKGYRIIVKDAQRYPLGSQFVFRLPDSQLEHLLAIALASQFVIDNHEAEAHHGFILRRVSQQDMPDDGIPDDSRKGIHIVATVLLHHILRLCREVLIPVCTPPAERLLVLAPTQYRLCIVLMEWPELHLIFHIIHLFEAAKIRINVESSKFLGYFASICDECFLFHHSITKLRG